MTLTGFGNTNLPAIVARATIAMLVVASGLAGCATRNSLSEPNTQAPHAMLPNTRAMNEQIFYERLLLCEDVWSQFESECKRELTVFRGIPHAEFCRAFARKRWPEQVLPACPRSRSQL